MSEPKLISPMLDDFEMGGPISDHDGVRCCPAMRKNSDEKYIVKIISVPASETKLDALLLTGACPDRSAALAYFKEQANGIADEKKILDNLSQLEGFVSFEDCQIVPMDGAAGYDVYLLSAYRKTLERQISRAPLTQLAAVNLGLDLCAGLAVCRQSGYLCVDLKPSNIYVMGDKEYRIGDLGFVRLNYLKYESLPDKYRSAYTAPEVADAFATLNNTIDIYAVGLILYQIFNNGILPFSGNTAPNESFDAPACADPEMAQIILKACDPDPSARWQDPVQMGQALVNYMQKNGVNDMPLVVQEAEPEEPASEPSDVGAAEEIPAEENTEENEEPAEEADAEATLSEVIPAEDADPVIIEESEPEEEVSEAESAENSETSDEEPIKNQDETTVEEEYDNLSFLDDWEAESAQILNELGDNYDGITDEVSEILGQVDSLAALQVPEPVVAPEPIEIKIPDPIPVEETTKLGASTAVI